MATNFPGTGLDNFVNPLATDQENTVSHSSQHSNINDAVEALEAKVGVNNSSVQTSHDWKLGQITGAARAVGTTTTQTLTNKTIDGDDNIIQDLALSTLKTILADASKFIVRDSLGALASSKTVPSGDVVGTSDTQGLSNKSLIQPYIGNFQSAQHNHSSETQGGELSGDSVTIYDIDFRNTTLTNPYKFSVYRGGAWTCGTSLADVVFDTKSFDTNNNFNNITGIYTAPVAGFYLFTAQATIATSNGGNNDLTIQLTHNGDGVARFSVAVGAVNTNLGGTVSKLLQLAASDTVTVMASNSISVAGLTGNIYTSFTGFLVSATTLEIINFAVWRFIDSYVPRRPKSMTHTYPSFFMTLGAV